MKRLALLVLFLLAAQPAFAGTGIFKTFVVLDTGAGNVFYGGGGATAPFFQTTYFAPTASGGSFTLNGAEINTFKNGSGNVTGASLFYRVTPVGGTPGAFIQVPLNFGANLPSPGDQRWDKTNAGIDLKAACGTGNVCALELYFQAFTNEGDRFDNNAGANFKRPFGVAPFADAVADNAGYRLLTTPMTGTTVGTLAGINLVQGVTGQYPSAQDNLYLTYNGTGYDGATDVANAILPGKGFFWLWYDLAGTAVSGGTSFSRELSTFTLPAASDFVTGSVAVPASNFVANSSGGSGFYMVGNPFAYPLVASGITADQPLQTTFQAWQPTGRTTGTYQPILSTQALARWQGVFAEVNSAVAPTFSFNALSTQAVVPQGPFYRGTAAATIAFALDGRTAAGDTRDEAAIVRLMPDARDGWDRDDASKLTPPAGPYALLAPVTLRDGAATRTAVTSLPADGAARTVPLAFLATDAGTYTLTWDASTPATLRDLVTGTVTDLATAETYTFTSDAAGWAERFELVLGARTTASEPTAAGAFRVLAARPNPVRGLSEVTVELGASQRVTADLFDALGRRVLSVYDGAAAAGPLALRLDASALAPGVYVLRVSGDAAAVSQTVTVVR